MKLGTTIFDGPNEAILVLPYKGKDLVFKAQAVLDETVFDELCPRPKPKTVKRADGTSEAQTGDKGYTSALTRWGQLKSSWIIVQSLKATPDLEWETVKETEPETWGNYREELKKCHFSDIDIMNIESIVWEANGMDQNKLDEAMKRFLAGQAPE